MAIRQQPMVKAVQGNTALELEAETGKSLLVVGVSIYWPTTGWATFSIDRATVGFYRVAGTMGHHLFFSEHDYIHPNLLAYMISKGWLAGYPVAEGQTFSIAGVAHSGSYQMIRYIEADAGDFKATDPNGSESREYLYLSYGRCTSPVADGSNHVNDPQTPVEFPSFPFDEAAPAGRKITLLGVAASAYGNTSGAQANQHRTTHLQLIRERKILGDAGREGYFFYGDAKTGADQEVIGNWHSMIGARSARDFLEPMVFPEPLVFSPGEELIVNLVTEVVAGVANIPVAGTEIGMIQRVTLD